MTKVDQARSMNALIDHQIQVAKTEFRRNPASNLEAHWRTALAQLSMLGLTKHRYSLEVETDELIRRCRNQLWSYERFRDRVIAP